jgi:dihydrofolate reductase
LGKIIYSMLTSLDGYIAAADGSLVLPVPETELHWYFNAQITRASLVLHGRRMYEVMRAWDTEGDKPGASEVTVDFARAWKLTPKIVFSTTLDEVGPNARLVKGDVETVVKAVKADVDGEIMVAGPGLAASLARMGLIDEYQMFVQPVVLGGGTPFFEAGLALRLKPVETKRLPQGVVVLRYTNDPVRD